MHVCTTNLNLLSELEDVVPNKWTEVDGVKVNYYSVSRNYEKYFKPFRYFSQSIGFLYSKEMKIYLDEYIKQYDIVHLHIPFVWPTYYAAKLCAKYDIPYVYHQRGVLSRNRLKYRFLKKFVYILIRELWIIRRASGLIALTEVEANDFKKYSKWSNITIIPNGIDVENAVSTSFDQANLYHELGLMKNTPTILWMARIHRTKGFDVFVKALSYIDKPINILIAGPDEQNILSNFDLSDTRHNVIILGTITGDKKLSILNLSDLYVLPSIAEGFSISILEALASGTVPVISPDCNFPEIESADVGIIVENSPHKIATAIEVLLDKPEQMRKMAERGKVFVKKKYTWPEIGYKMIVFYKNFVKL